MGKLYLYLLQHLHSHSVPLLQRYSIVSRACNQIRSAVSAFVVIYLATYVVAYFVASCFFFLVHGNYGLLTLTADYSTSFRPALGYYRHLGPVSEASDVQRHPRSLEMARIDRPYYTSCWWCAVTACLSRTISLILPLLRCTWLPVGGGLSLKNLS